MKIVKSLWKLLLGAGLAGYGWYLVAPEVGQTTLTGAAVIGIAFLTLGVSLLAEIWS